MTNYLAIFTKKIFDQPPSPTTYKCMHILIPVGIILGIILLFIGYHTPSHNNTKKSNKALIISLGGLVLFIISITLTIIWYYWIYTAYH